MAFVGHFTQAAHVPGWGTPVVATDGGPGPDSRIQSSVSQIAPCPTGSNA
jgi:hypothetical protein